MALDDPPLTPMQQLAKDAPEYPAGFVIPDRAPYSYTVDMGVIRSPMAAGNSRQRRAFTNMPHYLALSFHMRIEELYAWQNWINTWAYSWFLCPVSTKYAGGPPTPANMRAEVLRFTGDLAITMDGWNYVGVAVTAELSPNASAATMAAPGGGWIIGGTPADPNSAIWYIGGTPASPAVDVVNAGTPTLPASV